MYEHVVLRDGGSVVLRSLVSSDGPLLRELFDALGSTPDRFFAGTSRLTDNTEALADGLVVVVRQPDRESIVAAGRTARTGEDTGEFTVVVADAHLGRGIGTVLLEHLAHAARSAGIDWLEADVLADDSRTLQVFADSGVEIGRSEADGAVRLRFPTRETTRFVGASTAREREASARSLRVFFAPRHVAVVGASTREGSIGHALIANLLGRGFRGIVTPIHPQATEIAGLKAHPTVSDIGAQVDLAIVAVPASHVEAVLTDCARAGVRGVVVISAGFAEVSSLGRGAQDRLVDIVRGAGMRMVGPNCMGVLSTDPDVLLDATFAPGWPPAGNVSFLSQSGALGIAILDHAARHGIGIADFVSVGNRADVSSNDLLAYWATDDRTSVIALYLESIGNPRKFARVAPEVARKKPIVAVKSGRSASGTRAAASHSAALAGLDVAVDALFHDAGVLRTDTLEQLFDLVELLASQPVPPGPRVAVVTNAGGPGILFADACEARGLTVPDLTAETVAELRSFLSPHAGLGNPVDLIASATPEQFRRAVRCVGQDPRVDALVAIYVPPMVTRPAEVAAAIAAGAADIPAHKPVAAVFLTADGAPAELSGGPRGRIPCYAFPENAAIALSAAARRGQWLRRSPGTAFVLELTAERALRERLAHAEPDADGWLSPTDLGAILGIVGIELAGFEVVEPTPEAAMAAAARLAGVVALKAVAPGLVHKTEAGGVMLGLASPDEVATAARVMLERVRAAGFTPTGLVVQRQVEDGVEALVGVTTDPELGPVVVAGLGGVQVELLRDVAFRLVPVTDVDAGEMLDSLRASKLLDGFRGAAPADRNALVQCILRVSALVERTPELVELELNPVRVLTRGRGVVAVDARARVARGAARR